MTHCVHDTVFDRGNKPFEVHPCGGQVLHGNKPKGFTKHFSNPLNWEVLLNPEHISKHWGKEKNYSRLKICLAHFGGAEEWLKYVEDPWTAANDNTDNNANPGALRPANWNFTQEPSENEYSWFNIIKSLILKYENVYTDISFMLHNRATWPLLKVLLVGQVADEHGDNVENKLRKRILFGTDYYVVAQKGSERELSLGIRAYWGDELFFQIAKTNVEEYLSTNY